MCRLLKKLQNIVIIDKLTSQFVIHKKTTRFKGHAIKILLTNQSQVHPKGVMMAHVRGAQSHIGKYRIRPNRRPGRLRKFVLYHECQKIVKWAMISGKKVKSQGGGGYEGIRSNTVLKSHCGPC